MRAVVAVAVLPEYRSNFIDHLRDAFTASGDVIEFRAGSTHLDETVRTLRRPGVHVSASYGLVGRRLLWQSGVIGKLADADVVVVDLNPRSLTAWAALLTGRLRKRRTLVWGHILPRKGAGARTVPLRRAMRRMADGVISYTWSDSSIVRSEDPATPVWVAANGLYPVEDLGWSRLTARNLALVVGRLEPSKRPELALDAFAIALPRLPQDARLVYVGEGSLLDPLRSRAEELGLHDRIEFRGHVGDYALLREIYSSAVVSLSPGYAGLSLTQSFGFGVPVLVADDEPHAPEIELFHPGENGEFFRARDADSLAQRLVDAFLGSAWDHEEIVATVGRRYSSTAMAEGFENALRNREQREINA
ncbi:glycosyltransferase [Microbacterium sp. NPDC056736]|uniref:glycosyltransferase n=1 Tax=Microbacterium sp. NPDC056736 TaxID=3345932 RepID=UPI003672F2A2